MTKSLILSLVLLLGYHSLSYAQDIDKDIIKTFIKEVYENGSPSGVFLDNYFIKTDSAKKEKIINNLIDLRSKIVDIIDKENLSSIVVKDIDLKLVSLNTNAKPYEVQLNTDYSLGFWFINHKIKTLLWLNPPNNSTIIYYDELSQ